MLKKEVFLVAIFGVLFLFSVTFLLIQNISMEKVKIIGYATTGTTISNVTISKFLSITMSGNLSAGILFGSVSTLPATNINASGNNNSNGNTTFIANVSTDSNTAVDFCLKADANLYDGTGGNTLTAANESYANSTLINGTISPAAAQEVPFTTSYVWAGNISQGSGVYYRFWLDVPAGTPSGTYNNTITFKGVETAGGIGC